MRDQKYRYILLLIALFINISITKAQTGSIGGTVYDSKGIPVPDVKVIAYLSTGTEYGQSDTSGVDGRYLISNLPVGYYYVRISNSLVYVNEFYKEALNKSDATKVKVDQNKTTYGIDFYLDRGGFITGCVYSKDDSTVISSRMNVSFYENHSKTLMGKITSDEEGNYISPALPFGEYVISAGSPIQGYIVTLYKNAENWDDAEKIMITSDDTLSGYDFYLEKGGAISGIVVEKGNNSRPIKAGIAVKDWVTDLYCATSESDSITGYYCVAGLRSGTYRVLVYSVDPTKYHTQYYLEVAKPQDATPVEVQMSDTTTGINFFLVPVTYDSVVNEHIKITVGDNYPGTNFSLGTTRGLPDTYWDDQKPLLFGHPWPQTSYTTINIDGKPFKYGSRDGDFLYDNNRRVVPELTADGTGIYWGWICKDVKVEQIISIVESEWSDKKIFDTAKIKYVITNTSNTTKKIGLRILLDTMLGDNDGAPIKTPDGIFTYYEKNFYNLDIPAFWTAVEGDSTKTIFSAQGTLKKYGATTPNRFAIVKWNKIFTELWDYETDDTCKIIHDSAVALWWEPEQLNTNETREFITYYGLGEMIPDTIPPYITDMEPDINSIVNPDTNICLHVRDDYMGVNDESIKMWVDSVPVQPNISTIVEKKDYELCYNPPYNFRYNQVVSVRIYAEDRAYIPNKMDTTYKFTISNIKDTQPPYVTRRNPEPNENNVQSDVVITFHVEDDLTGVNKDSIILRINHEVVKPVITRIETDYSNYLVSYTPEEDFQCNDSVLVEIEAQDLADTPNIMEIVKYCFYIEKDTTPPDIVFTTPGDSATDVPLTTNIIFDVYDNQLGVNPESILMWIDVDTRQVIPKLVGDKKHYKLTYSPAENFKYNQTVTIGLDVQDLSTPPNRTEQQFIFSTVVDTISPYITRCKPDKDEEQVDLNTRVSFHIEDDIAGVDSSTIVLKIEGEIVDFEISGTARDYEVFYLPPPPIFVDGQTVSIEIDAKDLSNPQNEMITEKYKFRIKDRLPDLSTTLSVDSSKILVHHTVTLVADIINRDAPIKTKFNVIMKNDNQTFKVETIDKMSIDEIISFKVPLTLHDKGKYDISIHIDANNDVDESNEKNNVETVTVNVVEGKLIVRSNPFTPNDDGYNDFVGFDFNEFSLITPILKIYDFLGRGIVILDKYYNSKFIWDGKDSHGRKAQPGVYLYSLEDSNHKVAHGYVVLAR